MSGFRAILATDEALGIGKANDIPWHLPGDMAFFREHTTGSGRNAVIMGRKTYLAIPPRYRPLPDRLNVVLSRQEGAQFAGARTMSGLETSIDTLNADDAIDDVWVAGGAGIYDAAFLLPGCREVLWTEVCGDFGCDVRVLEFRDRFELIRTSEPQEENGITYRFHVLRPKKSV